MQGPCRGGGRERSKKLALRWDGHLRLAHELGKGINELMGWPGPMTGRQFRVWQVWLELQMNRPSRADCYAMQAAHAARFSMAKKVPPFNSKDWVLEFRERGPVDMAGKSEDARNAALSRLGMGGKVVTVTKSQMDELDAMPPDEAAARRRALAEGKRG